MIFVVKVVSGQQLQPINSTKASAALPYTHFTSNGIYPGIAVLPGNFYALNLGFVCKKEILLEKFSGIPLRFRLGSFNSTNRLEGKTTPLTSD